MARIEAVQAEGAREGERGGPHDRLGPERQAAHGLRPQTAEEDRDGGGPASIRKAIPTPGPPTPHDTSTAFFNRLVNSRKAVATKGNTRIAPRDGSRGPEDWA